MQINSIKAIHSAIWFIMAFAIFYILYCGIFGIFNTYLYLSYGLIVIEIITLIINKWSCPLTILAKKSKPDWKDGDDIFLPKTIAIHNKSIFGTLLAVGTILLLLRIIF